KCRRLGASHWNGARQSASRYARMSPEAARRPASRATTRPFDGSSTTRTPGIEAATAPVLSELALLTTMTSSGGRLWLKRECKQAGRKTASLEAQTSALIFMCSVQHHLQHSGLL